MRRKPGATASRSLRTWAINPCPTLYTSRPIKRCTSVTAIYNLQKTGARFCTANIMLKLNLKLERGFSRSFQHAQIVFSVIYASSIFIFPRRVCASVRTSQSPLTRLRAEYFCLRRTTVGFYLATDGHVVNNLNHEESFFKFSYLGVEFGSKKSNTKKLSKF